MSVTRLNPLPQDPLLHAFEYLDSREVRRIARVSPYWNGALQGRDFWIMRSLREGVPLVEGKERDVRRDFRILYPMVKKGVSRRDFERFFGPVVNPPTHRMSSDLFNRIEFSSDQSLFARIRSLFTRTKAASTRTEGLRRNFVIVNDPDCFRLSVGPERPFALDAETGRLQRVDGPVAARDIECPLTLHNIRTLFGDRFDADAWGPAFDQGDSLATGFCVMQETVADETRNKSWTEQEALVKAQGMEVTTLRVRVLFDLMRILTTGTCPDGRDPWTYVRTPQTVTDASGTWHLAVGGFAPGAGLDVYRYDYNCGRDRVGVVPCVPAEVLPAIGT